MGTREVVWSWLVLHPGRTAFEIARAALHHTGPASASVQAGSVRDLLKRMEKDGQVTRSAEFRAQQGREVYLWHAVPGAFTIPEGGA